METCIDRLSYRGLQSKRDVSGKTLHTLNEAKN